MHTKHFLQITILGKKTQKHFRYSLKLLILVKG